MNKLLYLTLPLSLLSGVAMSEDGAQTADSGPSIDLPALIRQCEECHGPGGRPPAQDIPRIAGMDVADFEQAIAEFYYYERHCPDWTPQTASGAEGGSTTMCNIASTLSEEETRALARHFDAR